MQHKNIPVVSQPSLFEAKSQFAAWRRTKKRRERIPRALWSAAVKLCENHSIHKISRELRLNHSSLRDRVADHKATQTALGTPSGNFVAVEIGHPQSSECVIEMEHRNGNKMRMHFKGHADLDLQSFADSFWS